MNYFIKRHNIESGESNFYPSNQNPAIYDDKDWALSVADGLNLSAEFNGTDNFFKPVVATEPKLPSFGRGSSL